MLDIISLLDQTLIDAHLANASDLHLEPLEQGYRLRRRVDGSLYYLQNIPYHVAQQLIVRVKVLSYLDISQKKLPQDGNFVFDKTIDNLNISYDIRVSIFPTINGEKLVLRFLKKENNFTLETIGLPKIYLDKLDPIINSKDGCILVTGPTGSGKTTTLYALLNFLNKIHKNIVTLEDPVEYRISGIFQTAIDSKLGLSFAQGIRNLLRQDPDIMLIGEIRDKETASAALESALTGHLVLTSLHTSNAYQSLLRLLHLDIDPVLLAGTLKAILSQRLIRKLCSCATRKKVSDKDKFYLEQTFGKTLEELFYPVGCGECVNGFKDRVAVFELLLVDNDLQNKMAQRDLSFTLKDNFWQFTQHAFELLAAGQIALQDLKIEF